MRTKPQVTALAVAGLNNFKTLSNHYGWTCPGSLGCHIQCLVAAVLFLIPAAASAQRNLMASPVPASTVTDFVNCRCAYTERDTFNVPKFPGAVAPTFVSRVYSFDEGMVPFQVYYSETPGGQLYLVTNGACRALHTTVPLPAPGFYFVRFYHEGKPSLIEIDARTERPTMYARGNCELHPAPPARRPKSNEP